MNAIQLCNISPTSDYSIVLDDLLNGDFQTRWEAAKTLVTLGGCVLTPLAEILATEPEETELVWFIARILGELNHPQALELLISLLQAEDEEVKSAAANALSKANPRAIAALSQQLVAEETRLITVRSLATIDHPLASEALLTVVGDPQVAVRVAAIAALSHVSNPRIPPILVTALSDIAAPVRREAIIGLGLLATRLRTRELSHSRPTVLTDLSIYTLTDLVALLQPCLWDINLDVCHQAAIALGRTGQDQAADILFQVLKSDVTITTLRLQCLRALAWMATPHAMNYLSQVFQVTTTLPLWQEAIFLLGRFESSASRQTATQILLDLFQTQPPLMAEPTIRQAIALSFKWLQATETDPEIPIILAQLQKDHDEQVRLHAITHH